MDEPNDVTVPFDIQVRLVYRERWRRILVLSGECEATVIYDSRGSGERVYLDGKFWARSSIWSWQIVYPFIEFQLPTAQDDLLARIDVLASLLPWKFGINRFRFSIAGHVLYDENRGEYWFRDDCGRVTNEPFEPEY
jgi:hypothetical protein